MAGPEAIIQQVWQKIVPTDWKIIRGKRRSAFAAGRAAAAWTGALCVLLIIAAVVTSDVLHASPSGRLSFSLSGLLTPASATVAGYPVLAVAACAALALALLAGVIATVMVARRHAGDPDPVIVLLPQGFVEFVSRHKPIIGILYAELAAVDLQQRSKRRSRSYQPGAPLQSSARGKTWLKLHYHDGRQERWRPRADFGPPERLCETIIKAHALYQVLYGDGH
ncbi:MAG TPA: hypothetical protein VFU69_13340 [Ktedonobacterales bacterium]|nr:hypothetical protein [Ktedonobacterales bacterium]